MQHAACSRSPASAPRLSQGVLLTLEKQRRRQARSYKVRRGGHESAHWAGGTRGLGSGMYVCAGTQLACIVSCTRPDAVTCVCPAVAYGLHSWTSDNLLSLSVRIVHSHTQVRRRGQQQQLGVQSPLGPAAFQPIHLLLGCWTCILWALDHLVSMHHTCKGCRGCRR